jgi:hypothetical protein
MTTIDPVASAQVALDLTRNLADPMWRISHLYKILIKEEGGEAGSVLQFKPNRAQRRFINNMHYRNIILKARQLGFTTLICIVWLDHALFNANARCGIIAQDKEAAEGIFQDKVKFAYENLPPDLRAAFPLERETATQLRFAHNNSSVRVATSMRSGTIHRLHISEFGKICAKYPEKAREVVTGSLPAVPLTGIAIIESTAEGTEGSFFDMTQRALQLQTAGAELTVRDFRMHFYAWHDNPDYRMNPAGVIITAKDTSYFERVEGESATSLDDEQRAWYVATRTSDFSGDDQLMWQEYPSTPSEAFQKSTEGNYYANEMAAMRKTGRICKVPVLNQVVNSFWDIGNSDGCAIWLHQQVGFEHRFIRYFEGHGENLNAYVKFMQDTGYTWGKHYFPHDADHKRLSDTNKSVKELMEGLGMKGIEIVPVISDLSTGIQMTRNAFPAAYFDEAGCAEGIKRLDNYKKKWNTQQGRYIDVPEKADGNSEGADAFRQFAQVLDAGPIGISGGGAWKRKGGGWKSS